MLLSGVYQPEESQSQEQLLRCTLPLKLANLSQRYGKYYVLYLPSGRAGWENIFFCSQDAQTSHSQEAFYHMTVVLLNFSDGVNLHQSGPIT